MEGEGHQGPSQGWRGRHQYGLPKDGGGGTSMASPKDGGHQYGPHERGRPLGAFPRMEGGGTSMASPRMEGEAPVWPPQGWRGRHQYGLPKDGGEGTSMAFPRMEGTSMALMKGEGH